MQETLHIGLLPSGAAELMQPLRILLEELGHQVVLIDRFNDGDKLNVVMFYPEEEYLESFLMNQYEAVWIALEPMFLEPRFSALLEFGVHDVLTLDDLSVASVSQTLLRAFYRGEGTRRMTTHDSLTGCLNAEGFTAHAEQAMKLMVDSGRLLGICSLDLASFQSVNEEHGYSIANQLLCMVAQRLTLIMGGRFSVGRLGGDEFLLLVDNLMGKEELMQALDLVRSSFVHRFEICGKRLQTTAFIGAVLYPQTLGSAEELIAQAHEAMETGKHYNQQVFFYDRSAAAPWFRMDMAVEIRRALRENEFKLYYQPRVRLDDNLVLGMEALLRWEHPKYGYIPPSDFIYAAENNGMILSLGNWVLTQAEQDIAYMEQHGLVGLNIAINLSFKQLEDAAFCEALPNRIKNWRGKQSQLEFELTETAVLSNPELVKQTLDDIQALGVRISLDDFGTGYSALVHVQQFPISIVKIDKSFVQRMELDLSARNIVESIIRFAHQLELEVVGEGIEGAMQLEQLRKMGCEQGQGYYFSKALPLEGFIAYTSKCNDIKIHNSSLDTRS
ncbi:MAG: bifunctional diguanylate cyclase/phosphodiesterase [Reinekea sp.]